MTVACHDVHELDRAAVERWLPCLDAWLLPGAFYGVRHTWPQLYRRDGGGRFFVLVDGDELVSHCATQVVTLRTASGPRVVCLLGSVVTAPDRRGRGHAGSVLATALAAHAGTVAATLLWAEHAELYARAGFVPSAPEPCLVLARRPHRQRTGVRAATIADHGALHTLHTAKPWGVERSHHAMSGLLTTPGMTTLVLERAGAVVAYACQGKGADLQGHWHELGGDDRDVAELLRAALHTTGEATSLVLLPPYRTELRELLRDDVVDVVHVSGPMVRTAGEPFPACWLDGLDSV